MHSSCSSDAQLTLAPELVHELRARLANSIEVHLARNTRPPQRALHAPQPLLDALAEQLVLQHVEHGQQEAIISASNLAR